MAADPPPAPAPPLASPPPAPAPAPPAPPVKRSWRRKYRKMRVRFDQAITTSNRLITDEWRAMGTARRLAEGNDQLLDMLLDINEQTRAPARLRFHLDPPPAVALSHALGPTLKSLAELEARVPHTTRADLPVQPVDGIDLTEHAPGYLSPAHEDEYLAALDHVLAQPDFDLALHEGRPLRTAASHQPLSDKDLTVRNPDSVYNWLRKHQPQVFLQDKDAAHHDNASEKPAPPKTNPAGRKNTKRESAVGAGTPAPRDHDDDDSLAGETAAKGRRKTTGGGEDDTAYRPKGGSSRPAKRKREDGDTPAGKSKKKSRASTGTAV
ncbi:hypothetical protein ACEQ8H_003215 [Pleosporales sp. CAS-2024a]